jgi:hypothetical protein
LLILVRTRSGPQHVETGGAYRASGACNQRSSYSLRRFARVSFRNRSDRGERGPK